MARSTLRVLLCVWLGAGAALGQQTTAFTYQGQLTDGGQPANGNWDLQFALFGTASGGTQIGTTQTVSTVPVSGGVFTVQLDFGSSAFPGANRFLEIGVRPAGGGSYTTLAPRHPITSTPYAIRTLSAATADALSSACVGCVQDTHIQAVAGSKVNGTISVASLPAGSTSYLQNTTAQQTNTNFNISGDGTAGGTLSANIINATSQYNLGGARMLSTGGTDNLFVGLGSGTNSTGSDNAFFGASAGQVNTTGRYNSFFGSVAGDNNTTGSENSFFGFLAGYGNTVGVENSFFGEDAGGNNTTGSYNTFAGYNGGVGNKVGDSNACFGSFTGYGLTGSDNTLVGSFAEVKYQGNLTNATAIGAHARVDQSDSLVLGSIAGLNGAASSVKVGIGTSTPLAALDTHGTVLVSGNVGIGTTTPLAALDTRGMMLVSGNVGIGTTAPAQSLEVNGITSLGAPGSVYGYLVGGGSPGPYPTLAFNSYGDSYKAGVAGYGGVLQFQDGNGSLIYYTSSNVAAGAPHTSTARLTISASGAVGIGTTAPLAALDDRGNLLVAGVVGIGTTTPFLNTKLDIAGGLLRLDQLAGGGDEPLCRNSVVHTLATCSSSLRYKDHVAPYSAGLELINRLRPISFSWKATGRRDLGLGAEDVAAVEPLLVTHNGDGEVEGVKYDHLNVVLINAIKQQQSQIEALQLANAALNARLQAVERGVGKPRLSDSARRSD